ncbi:hypothetical protein [Tautonia plasticadhaerens]|nr:hypothetical protein [Tautonia plasticadhaerens]
MDVADEIAYGVHDFEDGVALRLITRKDWEESVANECDVAWAESVEMPSINELSEMLFGEGSDASARRKRAIGSLVNALVALVEIRADDAFDCPLLNYRAVFLEEAKRFQSALQRVIQDRIIRTPSVQTLEYRDQINLLALFRAIESDPTSLLGGAFRRKAAEINDPNDYLRIICDYVSGMTYEYATKMFERLYVSRHGTVFDRL